MENSTVDRWSLETDNNGIVWNLDGQAPLPHSEHVEMSGRRVSVIVRYSVNAQKRLTVARDIFWPQLRLREGDVRGYLHRVYDDTFFLPRFTFNGKEWFPARQPLERIIFDGILSFHYAPTAEGIAVTRTLFPSRFRGIVIENWRFTNTSAKAVEVHALRRSLSERDSGVYGTYRLEIKSDEENFTRTLEPAKTETLSIGYEAIRDREKSIDCEGEESERRAFVRRIQDETAHLQLETPDPHLNRLFAFCKVRASESLFETAKMGLVHSPGGGNYYGGIWANDQAEYANPFFAFLNDADAHKASVNAYRHYAKRMKDDYTPVPTSFEMEGTIEFHAGGDRGDAAMIASGMSRYLLARGDRGLARELYPALQWCLEYCRRKTDPKCGVVLSNTDELEGRFPTGDANLSTSSLTYDGLRRGADVARALGKNEDAKEWDARADTLAIAIEQYFGATVEGFSTYRYYEANKTLRAWICLPLVFGLAHEARKDGTLAALFSPRLWTTDGLATEAGDKVFWDRSTLYGLRGALCAGATEAAMEHLTAYSRRRLRGDHVPYPVEAYPENAQAHLSAESALYCRIFIEGLLGLVPTGFTAFQLTPRLPKDWPGYVLRFTAFGERDITIEVSRKEAIRTVVTVGAKIVFDADAPDGTTHSVAV